MTHPLQKTEIHVFERVGSAEKGAKFVARLYPYSTWPIIFRGATAAKAEEAAENWLADKIYQETTTQAKRERALVKARQKRKGN